MNCKFSVDVIFSQPHHPFLFSENMHGECYSKLTVHACLKRFLFFLGWIDHFTNKYIVCGQLVENDAV